MTATANEDGPLLIQAKPKVLMIPVAQLRAAPWNYRTEATPAEHAALCTSIRSSQSAGVLCVRELPARKGKPQTYEVLDGNHRLAAIETLGWSKVRCENFGKITRAQAVVLSRQRNWQWFEDDVVKLGKLYAEDVIPAFDQDDLTAFLPESIREIDAIVAQAAAVEAPAAMPSGDAIPSANHAIKLTADQYHVVVEAMDLVRKSEGSNSLSDGRALELICADYMAG